MGFEVVYFATDAGRSQPVDFLDDLPVADAALIVADLLAFGVHGLGAPVSMRAIKGCAGLWEIRTRGFRSYYCVVAGRMWVLHVGRKQDQSRDIEIACQRMRLVTATAPTKSKDRKGKRP